MSKHQGWGFAVAVALGAVAFAGAVLGEDAPKPAASVKQDRGAYALAFAPDGKTLACSNQDGAVVLYEVPALKEKTKLAGGSHVSYVGFTTDGKTIVTAEKKLIVARDVAGEDEPKSFKIPDADRWNVGCAALSADNKSVAVGVNSTLYVWDIVENKQIAKLEGHRQGIVAVGISPDGKTAVSCAFGEPGILWDVAGGKEKAKLKGKTGTPNFRSWAFTPSGKIVAGAEDQVRTFFAGSGQGKSVLEGHTDSVGGIAFFDGGKKLATGSSDKTVNLWDANESKPKATLAFKSEVIRVAVSPDGKLLAVSLDTQSAENLFLYEIGSVLK